MPLFLQIFIEFFKTGLFSIGGGLATLPFLFKMAENHGWFTTEQLTNMIAISESTPGPIAVNMATFVGSSQGGILGALLATLGVVLPSFTIILIIAALVHNLLKYPAVQSVLNGVRPCVDGLILATAITMFMSTLFNFQKAGDLPAADGKALLIFGILVAIAGFFRHIAKKPLSPLWLIAVSAGLGMVLYSV